MYRLFFILFWHISQDTIIGAPGSLIPRPPTAYLAICDTSGSQRSNRSGRGLPASTFSPLAVANAAANAKANPSHAAFNSHNLYLQIVDLGAFLATADPGIRIKITSAIIIPGMINATNRSISDGTVSSFLGNDISGSIRLKERCTGGVLDNIFPTMPIALFPLVNSTFFIY